MRKKKHLTFSFWTLRWEPWTGLPWPDAYVLTTNPCRFYSSPGIPTIWRKVTTWRLSTTCLNPLAKKSFSLSWIRLWKSAADSNAVSTSPCLGKWSASPSMRSATWTCIKTMSPSTPKTTAPSNAP